MLYKVKLKNADDHVLLDDQVFEWLTNDPYLAKVDLVNNLRKHSSGCAVFQKTWKKADGGYKTETIYLHKLIAEKFLEHQKTGEKNHINIKFTSQTFQLVFFLRFNSHQKKAKLSSLFCMSFTLDLN